ncbi:MAG: FHA domain-containing protein [Elusimicrobia bacterium]|nr:FHA domain-containing protein [Elusimicrobiota bacterium]
MPKLLLKFNAAVIKEIAISKESLTIGRKTDNDIVIDNPAISGHHCRVSVQGGVYFVEDLESTNGTYVNEKRIKKAGLHHNDVVGLAKHSLVFLEDNPPPPSAVDGKGEADGTLVLTPEKQEALVAAATASAKGDNRVGVIRILKGLVGQQQEHELKGMSTYIGKSDRAQIQIEGGGLFRSAPEVAASIHRKPEGYVLVAVVQGYPLVNGSKVDSNVVLKEGDLIDCGGTTMQFMLKEQP